MGLLNFLTRTELERFGPPTPEEFDEIGVSQTLLCDLVLKHLSLIHIRPRIPSPPSFICPRR